jgi:hypothetical protein
MRVAHLLLPSRPITVDVRSAAYPRSCSTATADVRWACRPARTPRRRAGSLWISTTLRVPPLAASPHRPALWGEEEVLVRTTLPHRLCGWILAVAS